jgi:hypothetical protein
MDKRRRELEQMLRSNPTEFSFVQELYQLNEETGWTYEGRTVTEHVHGAVISSEAKRDKYNVPIEQFSAFPFLGVGAIPPLIEAFQSDDLSTSWKAAFALGQMGSAAITAIPALIYGLFNDHALIRAQSRWALAQLSEQSLPLLVSRFKENRRGEFKPLLEALVFMGSKALSCCDALTKSIRKANKNTALMVNTAVKNIIGESKSSRPENIAGPSYWRVKSKYDKNNQQSFEHAVWVHEVATLFHDYDSGDFEDATSWSGQASRSYRRILESWTPYKIVLRSPTLRLTDSSGDEQQLLTVESPNSKYFTLGDLCFLAAQNIDHGSPNPRGLIFTRRDNQIDTPTYMASCRLEQ